MPTRFGDPEPLDRSHTLDGFDCDVESLNVWLTEHARQAVAAGSARVFVMSDAEQQRVCGYYALAAAAVAHQQATERTRKGPIPAVLLARVLLAHALDDNARSFYERFGFEPSSTDPLNLQVLFKDIRKSLE